MRARGWGRLLFLVLFLLILHSIPAAAQKWLTFDGKEPLVIANGGHSGLYPHSSDRAFIDAQKRSLSNVLLLCDLRLMKDGNGTCLPDIDMQIGTQIAGYYPESAKTYNVNGVSRTGWFTIDYTYDDTLGFNLSQSNSLRSGRFDGLYFILLVTDLQQLEQPRLWINIQHDKFYTDHKLNMTEFLLNTIGSLPIDFVSSPELSFLRSVAPFVNRSRTQTIFRFLEKEDQEPSTGQTYGSLLNNLTSIRTFASGIIVPKNYIWPVSKNLELTLSSSSVVLDARKAGLKVFASGFANDFPFAYNYSYDPSKEYLSFIDNGVFSVDGILTDTPITASATIGCLAHANSSTPSPDKPIIISYGGSGGIFPSCTDLAYEQAIEDGADYIDCPVQVTKDGVLVCLIDVDLFSGTTIAQSPLGTRASLIPAIKASRGAYSFNFTWADIQENVKPQISSPFLEYYNQTRNPGKKNAGTFLSLADFLNLTKEKPPRSGVLISIENARFLAADLGFDVTNEVLKALNKSNLEQSVIIQSSDSSVLKKIQQQISSPSYKLMYKIDELVRDVEAPAVKEIASFASLVAVQKKSIYLDRNAYLLNRTKVVEKFKAENLSVFVYLIRNEGGDLWWDCYNDPIAEINTFVYDAGIHGLITEFPATADAFRRSRCTGSKSSVPYWAPLQLNNLGVNVSDLQPLLPAAPPLAAGDVVEPPLPSVPTSPAAAPPPASGPSAAPPALAVSAVLLVAALVSLLFV